MKTLSAFLMLLLAQSVSSAFADCKSDVNTVLEAMRAAGPIRTEHRYIEGGVVQTKDVNDFAPPDQFEQTAESPTVGRTITVLVSGKTAWSIIKSKDGSQDGPREFDGSVYIATANRYGLPQDAAAECNSEGSELHLIWKADNGKQFQEIVARADAQTHKLIAIDGAIKRKDGTVESEDHTTFSSIPAFTITPPKDAVKVESGPTYSKPADVDPALPLPPDAEKIITQKGVHFVRYSSPQKVAALAEFYRNKYKDIGWKEDSSKLKDTTFEAKFSDAKLGWVRVEIEAADQGSKVVVNGPYPPN